MFSTWQNGFEDFILSDSILRIIRKRRIKFCLLEKVIRKFHMLTFQTTSLDGSYENLIECRLLSVLR